MCSHALESSPPKMRECARSSSGKTATRRQRDAGGTLRLRHCTPYFNSSFSSQQAHMKSQPLRTTVIGSYPFPSWLEFACEHLDRFGDSDRAELVDDAVNIAVRDQLDA